MGYGFVSSDKHLQQSAGFFVDQDHRILFWPRRKAPGYIINLETALKIAHEKERAYEFGILDFPLGLGAIIGSGYLSSLNPEISLNAYLFFVSVYGLYRLYVYLSARKRISDRLRASQTVDRDRPQVRYLSTDDIDIPASLLGIVIGISGMMISFVLLLSFAATATDSWSERMYYSLACADLVLMILVFAYLKRRTSRVIAPSEIWFYGPTEEEIEKHNLSFVHSSTDASASEGKAE